MMKTTNRILKLANIADESKADPIQILEALCLKKEPAYIVCPTAPSTLITYALRREKSYNPWLPKQTLYRSYSREIRFPSDDTISNFSFKIPSGTFLKITVEDLKQLTVREEIEVSRFSGTMTVNIDNQLHQEVVKRNPRSYFTPQLTNETHPKQNNNRIPILIEHYIVTTKCSSDFENFCTEAPAIISITDIWVHEEAVITAINSILTQRRKNYPWRTPALGVLIEAAQKFFKERKPITPITYDERINIEDFLKARLDEFTESQIQICRILITPENLHREGNSNMHNWNLSREGIEDHISISLHHMIDTAKTLNEQELQSSVKYIKNTLMNIGTGKTKPFADKKLNCATKAIKLNQRKHSPLQNHDPSKL